MPESISVSAIIPASREKIYKAWLNSGEHANMTGSNAVINPGKGGKFKAWDGYITGKNIELDPFSRIVQSWRTSEFSDDHEDSLLEILLEDHKGKTRITLKHTNIPDGQGESYKKGWSEFYFMPMKKYFKG